MEISSFLAGLLAGILAGLIFVFLSLRGRSSLVSQMAQARSLQAIAEGKLEPVQRQLEQKENVLAEKEQLLDKLKSEFSALQSKFAALSASYEQEKTAFSEKLQILNEAKEDLGARFKSLANEIFEEKSVKFTKQNRDNLQVLLTPFQTQIKDFQAQVAQVYDKETRDRVSLQEQIRTLTELNQKVSEDTLNLTSALKGQSKTQGAWGELVLERVLEQSGLRKGREYDTQVRLQNDESKIYQPDVIIHLPNRRDVVIDSKVTLVSYEKYCSADETGKPAHLKALQASTQNHIKDLSSKVYQSLVGVVSLDFVLMFIPMEGAFSLILQESPEIFNQAFDKRIIMVSPTTLLATLRTIQNSWRYEDQNRNAQEIARRAGQLYDKFAAFSEDLSAIGSRLDSTRKAYDDAVRKLSTGKGNIIKRVEDLRQMGAPVSKEIPAEISMSEDEEDE
ncbi:MAG: DNA recombination protein RmuC [Spirochaetales bacterium]|nr:DNA recombination protein RmuC [Spirochaetales bacterium]